MGTMPVAIRAIAVALCLFVASAPFTASAAVPDGATDFIRNLGDEAIATLTEKNTPRPVIEKRFRELFRESFHLPAIGRFVLGRYWRQATPDQRQEFLALFEELVVGTYAARFTGYSGEQLAIRDARPDSEKTAIVHSEIVRPNGPPIRIDWRVGHDGNGFKVLDVVIEGISMAVTQRSEFASVIQRRGGKVEGLIEALRNKTVSLQEPATPQ